jgi:hypothetical protein
MERGIKLIDFETVDQMIQVHGTGSFITSIRTGDVLTGKIDYEGVSLSSRTANSKAAASTISDLFQKHYPEFLVRVPLHQPRAHYNPDPML